MIDEINVAKIKSNDGTREIELKADYKAFKKLNKLTGNPFVVMNEFAKQTEEGYLNINYELLPIFICAMCDGDITIEEIENEFLGLSYFKVGQIATIVNNLILSELLGEVEIDIEKKLTAPTMEKEKK